MSDDCSVNTLPPPLIEPHLSASEAGALTPPDSHLFAEAKNSYVASGAPSSSSTTTTARDSSASSSFTMLYPSSRTSSAEPTESSTSSIEPPTSPSALGPPGSPIRVPARLRRMYAQISEGHGDAATGKTKVVVVVGAAQIEETDSPPPPPTAGTIPAAVVPGPVPDPNSNPPERKAQRAAPRKRIPPPAPVPHLIKKSRGRRVPEPDEAKERAHICAVPGCSKSFARAEHLKRHVISLHTHEKPFVCECGKTFARRDNLMQHQRVHAT